MRSGMRTLMGLWGAVLSMSALLGLSGQQDDTPWRRSESGLARPVYGMRARGHLHSQKKRRLNARRAGHPL